MNATRGSPEITTALEVQASLRVLQMSKIPFQLRTTVGSGALSEPDFAELCQQLRRLELPNHFAKSRPPESKTTYDTERLPN